MKQRSPRKLLVAGFFLILLGVILPLLMVIHLLESTFFLNFISFAAQVSGLFLGLIGAVLYVKLKNR